MKKKSGSEKWNVNFDGMNKWNKGTEENGKEKDKVRIINRRKFANIPNPPWVKTNERWNLDNRDAEERDDF